MARAFGTGAETMKLMKHSPNLRQGFSTRFVGRLRKRWWQATSAAVFIMALVIMTRGITAEYPTGGCHRHASRPARPARCIRAADRAASHNAADALHAPPCPAHIDAAVKREDI